MKNLVYALSWLLLLLLAPQAGAADKPVLLPPVMVTDGLPPACALMRPVVTLERQELEALPAQSVAEALRFVPGVSLESRGFGAVQADVSLRGSTFSQVLVLIDGVRLTDPQTAHHNLDLPLLLEDVERIEVLQGPACARYGADAVAGAINIVTRTPRANHLRLEGAGGSFSTTRASAGLGGRRGWLAGSLSLGREASGGYRFGTDYEVHTLSGKAALLEEAGRETSGELFFGLQQKDFGAFDFYSPGRGFASREETGTAFASAAVRRASGGRLYEARAYFREHQDEFVLEARNPALYQAEHLSRVAGLQLFGQWQGRGLLSAGLELRGETLDSDRLGERERAVASPFAEYAAELGPLALDAAVRLDLYSRFGPQASPSLALLWRLGEGLAARAQVATAYRVPSFTELHYNDPANVGDPNLEPERSVSYQAGLVWRAKERPLEAALDVFERREWEIIDWVRGSVAEPWRAVNSGEVTTRGLEARADWFAPWGAARLDYIFADKGLSTTAAQSKYVLTHPVHQLSLGLWHARLPLGLSLFGQVMWRAYEKEDYTLLEVTLSRRFGPFELFAEGHNLLDASYTEALVPAPGIWGLAGLRIRLG